MAERYAYSTSDPDTLATYHRVTADMMAYLERIRVACAALGGNTGPLVSSGMWGSPDRLVALAPDGSGVIPDGWRMVRGRLEPKRGKAGDGARRWLDAHQPPDVRHALTKHGLPRHSVVPAPDRGFTHRIMTPTLFELDGTLWACYDGKPGDSFLDEDDACTWTPRKLSEFHAASEECESRKAQHAEAVSR